MERPDAADRRHDTLSEHQQVIRAIEPAVADSLRLPCTPRVRSANTLRLSFVTVPKAKIDEGIERLGRLIADECAAIRHGHAPGDSEPV